MMLSVARVVPQQKRCGRSGPCSSHSLTIILLSLHPTPGNILSCFEILSSEDIHFT
uniref:Candidate secreted effector n=1 Tax=Meloidogyne incognita TaxID=6306 RepID=A0A914KP37_MELIC